MYRYKVTVRCSGGEWIVWCPGCCTSRYGAWSAASDLIRFAHSHAADCPALYRVNLAVCPGYGTVTATREDT